jgi:hypothetical protein
MYLRHGVCVVVARDEELADTTFNAEDAKDAEKTYSLGVLSVLCVVR